MGTPDAEPRVHEEGPPTPKVGPGCKTTGVRSLPSLPALCSQEGRGETPTLQRSAGVYELRSGLHRGVCWGQFWVTKGTLVSPSTPKLVADRASFSSGFCHNKGGIRAGCDGTRGGSPVLPFSLGSCRGTGPFPHHTNSRQPGLCMSTCRRPCPNHQATCCCSAEDGWLDAWMDRRMVQTFALCRTSCAP